MYRRNLLDVGFDSHLEEYKIIKLVWLKFFRVEKCKKLVEECIEKLYEQVVFNQAKAGDNMN